MSAVTLTDKTEWLAVIRESLYYVTFHSPQAQQKKYTLNDHLQLLLRHFESNAILTDVIHDAHSETRHPDERYATYNCAHRENMHVSSWIANCYESVDRTEKVEAYRTIEASVRDMSA